MTTTLAGNELASALVRSLGTLLPGSAGVTLHAEAETIRIDDGGDPLLLDLSTYGAAGRLAEPEALAAVAAVLSTVQDVVSEALTEPWPQARDGSMALPDSALGEGWIMGLYGDVREPTALMRIMPLPPD